MKTNISKFREAFHNLCTEQDKYIYEVKNNQESVQSSRKYYEYNLSKVLVSIEEGIEQKKETSKKLNDLQNEQFEIEKKQDHSKQVLPFIQTFQILEKFS